MRSGVGGGGGGARAGTLLVMLVVFFVADQPGSATPGVVLPKQDEGPESGFSVGQWDQVVNNHFKSDSSHTYSSLISLISQKSFTRRCEISLFLLMLSEAPVDMFFQI